MYLYIELDKDTTCVIRGPVIAFTQTLSSSDKFSCVLEMFRNEVMMTIFLNVMRNNNVL